MPTQSAIQQTILNGAYSLGLLTNNNYELVEQGQLPIRKSFIQWFRLNLQALEDQYGIGDYISTTTVTLYDRINQFVGIPYGATVDPNFQNPNIIIETGSGFTPTFIGYTQANLVSDGQGGYYLPLTGGNGLTVVSVTINNVGQSGYTPDYTVTPAKLYGFANNTTQTIVIGFI